MVLSVEKILGFAIQSLSVNVIVKMNTLNEHGQTIVCGFIHSTI